MLHYSLNQLRDNSMAATFAFNDWAKQTSSVLEELQTKNSEIAAENDMDFNQRCINANAIRRYNSENLLSDLERIDLFSEIAHQCPLAGGNAVFAARTVLASLGFDENYSDDELCTELGYMRYGQTLTSTINLLPNPAQNFVTVAFNKVLQDEVALDVFDVYGRLIESNIVSDGQSRIDLNVSGLNNGVYEIKCHGKEIGTMTKKLIVSR